MSDETDINRGSLWQQVDRHAEQAARYLVLLMKLLDDLKQQTIDDLHLTPGMAVIDVGCGIGGDAVAMAHRVGAIGRVVGIDSSAELIAQAKSQTGSLGLPLQFQVGDAQALDFPDNSFDAARVDRVLQHLPDPERALREMVRVVRPGGRIAALEPDWESLVLGGVDKTAMRALVRHRVDVTSINGTIGRELKRLVSEAGCTDIVLQASVVTFGTLAMADQVMSLKTNLDGARDKGWISAADADAMWRRLEELDRADRFYAAMSGVLIGATVP